MDSLLKRVLRGGSWRLYQGYCRAASRFSFSPDDRLGLIGFRLVGVEDGQS